MKETKKIKIKIHLYQETINDYRLFKWVEVSKIQKGNNYLVELSRDLEDAKLFEIQKLEKEYFSLRNPEIISVGILMGIAFIFFTLFIVFYLGVKLPILTAFLAFLLPALLVFSLGSIIFFLKGLKINKIIRQGENIKNRIKKELKEL